MFYSIRNIQKYGIRIEFYILCLIHKCANEFYIDNNNRSYILYL